jgi:glycosyltransferase involved in cell wall biosynthesis
MGLPRKNSADWKRISKIAEILTKNGHEVQFAFYVMKKLCEKNRNIIKDNDFPYNYDVITYKYPFILPIKQLLLTIKGKYNLVYCNLHGTPSISILNKFVGIPLIFDMHGDPISENELLNSNLSELKKYYLKFINFLDLHISNKIFCVSSKMIEETSKKGISKDKLVYITNGVELKYFRQLQKYKKNREIIGFTNELIFGYIGAFQKWQGIENFIKAAKTMNDKYTKFLIVGGNNSSATHNLIIISQVSNKEIINYYSICDIFVLPRPYHNATNVAAPTKFAEYCAMGKPILTTDVGDAAYLVKKYKCGVVVENNNPENLIDGFNRFKKMSKEDLKIMGRNARKLAEEEFDWDKISARLLETIELYLKD